MLDAVDASTLDELIARTVPADIRTDGPLSLKGLESARGEAAALDLLRTYAAQNRPDIKSLIGQGYYGTRVPSVILRNVLENPAWYTPYTPYQAEMAQGRLEAILNYQTAVSDLTGLPLTGASLLDEATAAAEAMGMCLAVTRSKTPSFFVADDVHPQTLAVVRTRARTMGVDVTVGPVDNFAAVAADHCGVLVQTPSTHGRIYDPAELKTLADAAHAGGALVVAATDLLACCLTTPPGAWGADIAVGSAQRFGVPMGYGGPHAGFLSTHEKHARRMPGRLIGLSRDAQGTPALRMALQTREQHIRRDKATSNICTAQVLLAVAAGFYAVYHGPEGLRTIARAIHDRTRALAAALTDAGLTVGQDAFFDTLSIQTGDGGGRRAALVARALDAGFNLRNAGGGVVNVALDETVTDAELNRLAAALTGADASSTLPATPTDRKPARRRRLRPPGRLPHPPGLHHAPHRARAAALRHAAHQQGLQPRPRHDPAGLVHHEAQRRVRDAAHHLAGLRRPAPLRPRRSSAGLPPAVRRPRRLAVRNNRLREGQPAAQRRQPGRIRRPAGHPRLAPRPRRHPSRALPDPHQRARHQPRLGGHRRHEGGARALPRQRRHRPGAPARAGPQARRNPVVASWSPTPRPTACSSARSARSATRCTNAAGRSTSTART